MASDYYGILGVSQSASTSEIRAAYRRQVKQYHPDTSEYNDSELIFKQLKTGYNVLGNRQQRAEYNRLAHDEYVKRHGGYTQSEIRDATETQIQVHPDPQGDATNDWRTEQQQRVQEQRAAAESGSIFYRLFQTVIHGRTPTSDGTLAFAVRLSIYTVLVGVIALPIAVVVGGFGAIRESFALSAGVLLISRIMYLSGFEYLRSGYLKIDRRPEPDAYTIPYALALASVVLFAMGVVSAVSVIAPNNGNVAVTVVAGVALLLIYVAFPISLMWAILSVGFGVADDRYNLQYDVSPVRWNFAAQAPVLLVIAGFGHLSTILLVTTASIPFVVAGVFLLRSHREIGSELRWRISNGRVFANQ